MILYGTDAERTSRTLKYVFMFCVFFAVDHESLCFYRHRGGCFPAVCWRHQDSGAVLLRSSAAFYRRYFWLILYLVKPHVGPLKDMKAWLRPFQVKVTSVMSLFWAMVIYDIGFETNENRI